MFKLIIWIDEIITKKWALVSLDLDKRAKSYKDLKNREMITDRSLIENKKEKSIEQTLATEANLANLFTNKT